MNCAVKISFRTPANTNCPTDLFLLHQLGVRAVIDHILSKDRCGQDSINFLRVDIFQLAIENEVVALSTQVYSSFLAQ